MVAGSGVEAEGGTGVGDPWPGCVVTLAVSVGGRTAGAGAGVVTPVAFRGSPAAAAVIDCGTGITRI